MFNQVFISHAKEDYGVAESLYNYLTDNGYSPWLDKKSIRVGEDWDYAIKKALRESTFVILLLSSTSVKKRGYVQKEFKYALEYSETKLVDDIYIIPILLDNCDIPHHLKKYQWAEIDKDNAMDEILSSLNIQRKKYLDTLSPEEVSINDYTTVSISLNTRIPSNIDYSCTLPLFSKNKYFDSHFVNIFIQQKALERISEYRAWINELYQFLSTNHDQPFYLSISHSIKQLNETFLSLSISYDSYLGGAHPHTNIDTLNFSFNPDAHLKLYDIVMYNDLRAFINDCILRYGDSEQKQSLVNYTEYLTEDNLNFTFDNKTLEIDLANEVPRVILALSSLEIPMINLELRKD